MPHEKLFGPLGMRTAALETDAAGTYAAHRIYMHLRAIGHALAN